MRSSNIYSEVKLTDRDVLLSTTDLDSRITYANGDFCRIAGYAIDDMLGQPHNLVRHPDMPPVAFENMWKTIRAGKSWMGPVKNRCRNGNYYWVNAFVTPIRDADGHTCEYQSVRTQPDDAVVARAEQSYQALRQGNFKPQFALADHHAVLMKWSLTAMVLLTMTAMFANDYAIFIDGVIGATCLLLMWVQRRFSARLNVLASKCKETFDNPLMSYLYSGHHGSLADINLALEMQQAQLRAVVGRVNDASQSVRENSANSLHCSDEVSLHLRRQISEVSQVANAVEQLSQTIGEISSNVNGAAEVASESEVSTFFGKGNVDATIQNIHSLNRHLAVAGEQVNQMSAGVQSIDRALRVITGIAGQTNLLAINAAIEAAHNGESGNGFVVVAGEVRELANRTQQASASIQEVLQTLSAHSQNAYQAMELAVSLSQECVGMAENCGNSLLTIQNEVSRLADLNRSIAAAIEQQSVVAGEVTSSINEIMALASHSGEVSSQARALNTSLMTKVEEQSALIRQFA